METVDASTARPQRFRQPRPLIRWLAVILATAGWYVSLQLLRISAGASPDNAFLHAVCGGAPDAGGVDDCTSVLSSPQAYIQLGPDSGGLRLPVSALGMAYFAAVGLWYLFVGPPARSGRAWHLLILMVVLVGAWQSLNYMGIMHHVLRRWCGGCLAAHAVNGGLLLLTLLAWPWRRTAALTPAHPSARLALATATAGVVAGATHLALVYVFIAGNIMRERTAQYAAVLNDPAFILWDFNRQPAASIPLREDEVFGGDPTAPNTAVVFGDFQCTHCRQTHEVLMKVAAKYPDRIRVAFRHYPQDPECNPHPRFRAGAHASACRAARAVEAARSIGGPETYLAMRQKLWEHQNDLPKRPYAQQSERERRLFEDWATELGLDRAAFATAMESPETSASLQADMQLAGELGIEAIPVVYVNGKRLRNWSRLETWDVILGAPAAAASQP